MSENKQDPDICEKCGDYFFHCQCGQAPSPQFNAGEGSGKVLRWVKASERLPNSDDPGLHFRLNGRKVNGNFYQEEGMDFFHVSQKTHEDFSISAKCETLEWLEETDAPAARPTETPVSGEVPADVMEWIKTTCKEMYPYVYDDDAHALSVDSLRHECKKIAIAMYHKMKEDQTELLRTLIIEQAKELSDIQDQLTEATRQRDQYKEWWEKSEKAFAELADKALEISKERDAMRAQLEDIANETGWEYVKTFLAKYPKQ